MDWETGLGIADMALNLFNTGYNLYTNQRDFDYQKALQQQIFEREDTATQRRIQDLKAAGLNPSLATGQGAGAGSVVSRSNTNDLNIGSMLDSLSAMNQIKLQRQQTENAKTEGEILKTKKSIENINNAMGTLNLIGQLGLDDVDIQPIHNKDGVSWSFTYSPDAISSKNTTAFKNMKYQLDYLENSNNYLNKELNWYNFNQVMDNLTSVGSLFMPKFMKKLK